MTGYTFIYNGRKYWVPQGVPMEKAINYINSEKIGIGGVAGATVTAKGAETQISCSALYSDYYTCGVDQWTKAVTYSGQVIGTTTGNENSEQIEIIFYKSMKRKNILGYEIDILNNLKTWVLKSEVNILAGNQAEGAGFPISLYSKGNSVKQLQNYLKGCGFSLGTHGADGDWGSATQTAIMLYNQKNPNSQIPFKVNSQSELNTIISKPCTNVSTNTNAGGTTQGSGTGSNTNAGGTTQGSGTGSNTNAGGNNAGGTIIKEEPITTTPPKDNTLLWVASAFLAKKIFFGKKGKKK